MEIVQRIIKTTKQEINTKIILNICRNVDLHAPPKLAKAILEALGPKTAPNIRKTAPNRTNPKLPKEQPKIATSWGELGQDGPRLL